jgi:hypothetical protein
MGSWSFQCGVTKLELGNELNELKHQLYDLSQYSNLSILLCGIPRKAKLN